MTNEQMIVNAYANGRMTISSEPEHIAEELIAEGGSLAIELSDGMYKAINALISAYDNQDEEAISLYEAIAEDRVNVSDSATKGYSHASITHRDQVGK